MLSHWLEEGFGGGIGLRRLTAGLEDVNSRDLSMLKTLSEREREREGEGERERGERERRERE